MIRRRQSWWITDTRECRAVVPPFYNEYAFTKAEPGYAPEFEEAIMLFRPYLGRHSQCKATAGS